MARKSDTISARKAAAGPNDAIAGSAGRRRHARKLSFRPRAPFDFHLSALIFARGDPGIQSYDGRQFQRVLQIGDELLLVRIRPLGTTARPRLEVRVTPERQLSAPALDGLRHTVEGLFNLRLDLAPFYHMAAADPVLSRVAARLLGLRNPTTPTPHEALVNAIIEQQISLRAAWSMQHRMIKTFGEVLEVPGGAFYAFPTPARLGSLEVSELKACGLSTRKAEYVIGVSGQIARRELNLDRIRRLPSADILPRLTALRGVGRWTAEMAMLRGMAKLDAFPADDLGLRRLIGHYYGNGQKKRPASRPKSNLERPATQPGGPVSAEAARRIAEPWGEWKGLAVYYLLVARMTSFEA